MCVCVCVFTGGQTLDIMYRCELDVDDTHRGSIRLRYEGDDFLSLDLHKINWTPANSKAEIFLKEWESAGDENKHWKNYLSNTCIEWLKQYVYCKTGSMERKGKVCDLCYYNNYTHTHSSCSCFYVSVITHIIVFDLL